MNSENNTIVTLKKGEGRALKAGGAWVYDNEIETITGRFKNGSVVTVHDNNGFGLGKGFINQNSTIRIRMLTRNPAQEVDEAFIRMRVKNAWEYRKEVLGKEDISACRLVFGEADWLPGIVVDKYEDVLVVESLALGIEPFKPLILQALKDCLKEDGFEIRGIFERSDAPVRKKEGLEPFKGFVGEAFDPHVCITENGVKYEVDVENGQKTGFFLDQKFNRRAIQSLVKGKKVLDCFTHMGTFALNAGLAGAESVLGLDISGFAIAQATKNAELNGLSERVKFREANVLDELPVLYEAGESFDFVVLDPPAFTKSREATRKAIKGYREINMTGMKLVRNVRFLATCSCSHFMTEELFKDVVSQAAKSVHKRLRQVYFGTQAPDHPILWSADESYYLKFFIFQVCDEL
ncbi:MAG: class I SAM-dependent rRNA methyltransferase [Lachnospiraceae bacterium]|nr:class I SAM-dependent rRNA methyltransferase [Lachnospiraceae bacterium]